MKKKIAVAMTLAMLAGLTACGSGTETTKANSGDNSTTAAGTEAGNTEAAENTEAAGNNAEGAVYTIGLCNYVDDASLNQIVDHLTARLDEIEAEQGVTFEVDYQNCNTDSNLLNQIIANYIGDQVDLMVGVATPVAMAMQAATEDNQIPVVFSAVSDPVGAGLVDSLEAPGSNLTGTSDYLNTEAVLDIMLAVNPDLKKVGLLYDVGQDSAAGPIEIAKEYFADKGIEVVEQTGSNPGDIQLAAASLVSAKVEAVFTPTDNTVMTAETSIYETFMDAGIPHYCGADSFALNGAFLGYGVDYAYLGEATADMIAEILIEGKDPATTPALTFDNGTATVNEEVLAAFEMDIEALTELISPYCTEVKTIQTADYFEN